MLTLLHFKCYVIISSVVGFFFIATFRDNMFSQPQESTTCSFCVVNEVQQIYVNSDIYSPNNVDELQQTHNNTNRPLILGKVDSNRKYAVLSTSAEIAESLGHLFLLPLTALAWKRIGFDSIVIIVGLANVMDSDPLLQIVVTELRKFDAVVIFLNAQVDKHSILSQVPIFITFDSYQLLCL